MSCVAVPAMRSSVKSSPAVRDQIAAHAREAWRCQLKKLRNMLKYIDKIHFAQYKLTEFKSVPNSEDKFSSRVDFGHPRN
jgi:hypothetical protein